jgi:hypothetical protein
VRTTQPASSVAADKAIAAPTHESLEFEYLLNIVTRHFDGCA